MAEAITLEEARRLLAEAEREYRETKAVWDAAEAASRAHTEEARRLRHVAQAAHSQVQNAFFINVTLGELTPHQYAVQADEAQRRASEALQAHMAAEPPYHAIKINDAQSKYEALAWLVRTLERL